MARRRPRRRWRVKGGQPLRPALSLVFRWCAEACQCAWEAHCEAELEYQHKARLADNAWWLFRREHLNTGTRDTNLEQRAETASWVEDAYRYARDKAQQRYCSCHRTHDCLACVCFGVCGSELS